MINKISKISDVIFTIFGLTCPFLASWYACTHCESFFTIFDSLSEDEKNFICLVVGISFSCFFSLFSFCCLINVLIRKVISRIKANQ